MRLQDIADVYIGYHTNREIKDGDSSYKYNYSELTIKSLGENEILKNFNRQINLPKEMEKKYISIKGDILLKLRNEFKFGFIKEEDEGVLIPYIFTIIRPKKEEAAKMLFLYFKSELFQKALSIYGTGSMNNISTPDLLNLKIPNIENFDILFDTISSLNNQKDKLRTKTEKLSVYEKTLINKYCK